MSREVLQQALAVLKGCLEHPDAQDSIIAIEHELAQQEHPEQMARLGWQYVECPACGSEGARAFPKPEESTIKQSLSVEQEPVASMEVKTSKAQISYSYSPEHGGFALPDGTYKFYTSPPQRTWVHLTNQEHDEIAIACGCLSADWVFYGAVLERKIKEKNTT